MLLIAHGPARPARLDHRYLPPRPDPGSLPARPARLDHRYLPPRPDPGSLPARPARLDHRYLPPRPDPGSLPARPARLDHRYLPPRPDPGSLPARPGHRSLPANAAHGFPSLLREFNSWIISNNFEHFLHLICLLDSKVLIERLVYLSWREREIKLLFIIFISTPSRFGGWERRHWINLKFPSGPRSPSARAAPEILYFLG